MVAQGDTLTLTVQANGSNPLQLSWRFNGAEIEGETGWRFFAYQCADIRRG